MRVGCWTIDWVALGGRGRGGGGECFPWCGGSNFDATRVGRLRGAFGVLWGAKCIHADPYLGSGGVFPVNTAVILAI